MAFPPNRYFSPDPAQREIARRLYESAAGLDGHYPAVRLGLPWRFFDRLNGMERYFDQVMETAGLYNTAGFNDDTRAYPSIPVRHDPWRRASASWAAGLVTCHIVDEAEGYEMTRALAYDLAKDAYCL